MKAWIVTYVATAIAFLACDAVWLSFAAQRLYRPRLGGLLLDSFSPAPAVGFYLVYIAGVVALAVAPGVADGRWTAALWRGALLGLVAYATYDLTNQATLRGWSGVVTVADLCWGTALTALAAVAGFLAARWMLARG